MFRRTAPNNARSDVYQDRRLDSVIPGKSRHRLWITWECQRRNRTLSRSLRAQLLEFDLNARRIVRYPVLVVRTWRVLVSSRPSLVFVQNPSLLLAALAVTWGRFSGVPVVVDAHNAGVHPFDNKHRWPNELTAYIFRHAALTVVSNPGLENEILHKGGRVLSLPDPIPPLSPGPARSKRDDSTFEVLFICSWSSDEPYLEVLRAAREVGGQIRIFITGDSKGRERAFDGPLPSNVILTGFVSEAEFILRLHSCDVVMDLTTRENCLVCGAYEATAVEKPMILSATECLRNYFSSGVVYTNNTVSSIVDAIHTAYRELPLLQQQIKQLKQHKLQEWDRRLTRMEEVLAQIERL
jgi:hypothetical protein